MCRSVKGTVIDVQVFTRDGVEKDQRAKDIEYSQLAEIRKNLDDEYRIVEAATYERLQRALSGNKVASAPGLTAKAIRLMKSTCRHLPGTIGSASACKMTV